MDRAGAVVYVAVGLAVPMAVHAVRYHADLLSEQFDVLAALLVVSHAIANRHAPFQDHDLVLLDALRILAIDGGKNGDGNAHAAQIFQGQERHWLVALLGSERLYGRNQTADHDRISLVQLLQALDRRGRALLDQASILAELMIGNIEAQQLLLIS